MKVKYLRENDTVFIIDTAFAVTPMNNATKALIEYVSAEGRNTSIIIPSGKLLSITVIEEKK